MNLQALTSLSKVKCFGYIYVFLGLSFIITSCNTGDKNVSGVIQPKGEVLSTIFRNDFELKTSVMLYDTIVSNNSQRLLIGSYTDSIFGSITANSYSQFFNPTPFSTFGPNPKLDSTLLYISFTQYINVSTALGAALLYNYGTRGASQTIYFHRLAQDLDTKRTYTTNNSLQYDPEALGKLTFINPVNAVIELDSDLGQEFLDNPNYFTSSASFISAFKGMAIVNGLTKTSTSVWGIADLQLVLKYHNFYALNNLKVNESRTFLLSTNPLGKFNQVIPDRSTGKLQNLVISYDSLTTTQTQKACYIQSNSGVGTVVRFPFLDTLRKSVDGKILVDRAQIVIQPEIISNYPPPPFLIAYELNSAGNIRKNNGVNVALQNENNIFGFTSPILIPYDFRNNRYVVQFTTYMQALIDENNQKPNYGLLFVGFDERVQVSGANNSSQNLFYANVNRAIFYNDKNSPYNIKLNLHYSPYK